MTGIPGNSRTERSGLAYRYRPIWPVLAKLIPIPWGLNLIPIPSSLNRNCTSLLFTNYFP